MYACEFKLETEQVLQESLRLVFAGSDIVVYLDPDVDGVFTGVFICWFLDWIGKPYTTYINSDRSHSFDWRAVGVHDTIIAVDFSIPADCLQALSAHGVNVINIDHHDLGVGGVSEIRGKGIAYAVNSMNESGCYHFMSAGVLMYHVLAYWCQCLGTEWDRLSEIFALSGITLLSDVRIIENDMAYKHLVALERLDTEYSRYLISHTKTNRFVSIGKDRLDRLYIDFTLSPALNAMFRGNASEAVVDFLLHRSVTAPDFSFYREVQKHIITEVLPLRVAEVTLSSCVLIRADVTGALNLNSYIGLYANKVLSKAGKTVLIMAYDRGKFIRGSCRGKYDLDYRHLLLSLGLSCAGHASAFGILPMDGVKFSGRAMDEAISSIERVGTHESHVVSVYDLSHVSHKAAKLADIARSNQYVRTQNQTVLKYLGDEIGVLYSSEKYIKYKVNGMHVDCFDSALSFETGVILPILDRGYVTLTLCASR